MDDVNWLLKRLARFLLGPAVDGITDEMLDGITLAIHEEAALMGLTDPTGA